MISHGNLGGPTISDLGKQVVYRKAACVCVWDTEESDPKRLKTDCHVRFFYDNILSVQ